MSPVAVSGPQVRTFPAAGGVPWSAVGPGWFLAAVDGNAMRLVLVDPTGRHYQVYVSHRQDLHVAGWSGDGQRVLLQQGYGPFPQPTYVVDLRTGQEWRPQLPRRVGVIGFTRPKGLGLLTVAVAGYSDGVPTNYRIERRDLDGHGPVPLSGDQDANDGNVTPGIVYLPTGSALAINEAGRILLIDNASGQPLRSVRDSADCSPVRMWDATRLLAGCPRGLTLLSTVGDPATLLVSPHSKHGPDYDDINVWLVRGALYTDSLGACGYEFVGRVEPDGHVQEVRPTDTVGNTIPLTVWHDRLAIAAVQGCEGPDVSSLFWFDPTTRAEQVLWSPRRGDKDVRFFAMPEA